MDIRLLLLIVYPLTLILVWLIVRLVDPRPNYMITTYDSTSITEPNPRSLLPPRLGSGASAQNNTLLPVVRGSTQLFGEDLRASAATWSSPSPPGDAPDQRPILRFASTVYQSAPDQIDGYAGLDSSMTRGRTAALADPSTSPSTSILHDSVGLTTNFGEGSGTRAYLGWRPDIAAAGQFNADNDSHYDDSGYAPCDWLTIRRGKLLHTLFETTRILRYDRPQMHWMFEDSAAFNAAFNLSLADWDTSSVTNMHSMSMVDSSDLLQKRLIREAKLIPYSSLYVPGQISYALFSRTFICRAPFGHQ